MLPFQMINCAQLNILLPYSINDDNFFLPRVRPINQKHKKHAGSHRDGDDFGFSACVSYASSMWNSYGPYMTRIEDSRIWRKDLVH